MPIDTTLTSRYELKYLLTPSQVSAIRTYIKPFVRPDDYASLSPWSSYTITSLYLDTEELDCFEATREGHKTRFKLRIRTYTDHTEDPAFFEVKKRLGGLIRKSRAKVTRKAASELFTTRFSWIQGLVGSQHQDFKEFIYKSQTADYYPVMFVRYEREAYQSTDMDPVRVTFDSNITHAVAHDTSLTTWGLKWTPTSFGRVIMEVKFTDLCPSWARDMIHAHQLQRASASKYARAVGDALRTGLRLPAALPGMSTVAMLAPT